MKFKLLLVFLLLLPISLGVAPIDFNVVSYNVVDDKVYVREEIHFHLDGDTEMEILLPEKYNDLSIDSGGERMEYNVENNKAILVLPESVNQLVVEYNTRDFLDNGEFNTEFENQLDARFLFLEVSLPGNSVVKNINPEAREILNEDNRVKVKWREQDVVKGDKSEISLSYSKRSNIVYFVIPALTIVVVVYYFVARKGSRKA